MKNYIKHTCLFLLLLGTSVGAWGAIYIEYEGENYYNGNTITINVDLDDDMVYGTDGMTIKNDGDGWSPSSYYYGYIHATISGTYVYSNLAFGMAGVEGVNGTPYWVDEDHYTSFAEWNNWPYETLSFYTSYAFDAAGTYNSTITIVQKDNNDASTLQSATITVSYVVAEACTPNDVVYGHEGTGGNDPTGDDSACAGATVTFTPDPSSGYEYSGATVYLRDMETVHASLNASTTSFTMPNEDVLVVATYAPIDYTISFNANGGSNSMGDVVRAYDSSYELPACGFTAPAGKVFKCWAEGSAGGTERAVGYSHTVAGNITFYAKWRDGSYTDYVFSCSELTLTPKLVTAGTPIFITSAAGKTVRSQDTIQISGTGLTPSTTLTFPNLPSKFEIKKADGSALVTNGSGAIEENAFIFYTPGEGDTSDGLDQLTGITVSVGGAKPKQASLVQSIIGRHIATDFVIAVKKNGKWYALPDTMTATRNPQPIEIAVDDYNNPSVAYTASTNIYNLYGQVSETIGGQAGYLYTNGETVKFGMKNNTSYPDYPLFASATGTTTLGKGGLATSVTNNIGSQYWWTLKQFATEITNPQDAKYYLRSSNNAKALRIKDNPAQWGMYASGDSIVRLIPASNIPFTEASVVEWGRHSAIVEVDAQGIGATSVVAHLAGVESAAITLVQTKANDAKNKTSKYNYTVNFGDAIDFADPESNGAMMTLEWKNGATVKAMSNIVVPRIIATNATMSAIESRDTYWTSQNGPTDDVHVLPGVTLTADAGSFSSSDVTIKNLEIYPGATVKVTTGTLDVTNLVMRNGWTRANGKAYDVARIYISSTANMTHTNAYADWYIDYDQYYPIAVSFPVATSGISYKNSNSLASAGVIIRYYDGARRAENGQHNQDENWVAYTWGDGGTMPANLEPSKGYAMTAKRPSGKAFSIVRMPMTFSNPWTALGEQGYVDETHKDQVSVTGYGKGTTPWYAMGWNFIGNPYMSVFNEDSGDGISGKITKQEGGDIKYATIPDLEFKNYDQVPIAEANLKPASAFFIQADNASAQTITFNANKIVPPSAPAHYTVKQEKIPEQEAYIRLSYEEGNDLMGLIIGEDYTAAYEPNADLAKLLGEANAVKTYMHYGEMNMAYVAINEMLAKEWIPITVNIPKNGEYTYSLTRSSIVSALEGIYLIDYANSDKITNLLEDSYTFHSETGTISGRFAINAKVGERPVPTDLDIVGGDTNGSEPVKFIYREKVFILHNGVIYDATGKKVKDYRL